MKLPVKVMAVSLILSSLIFVSAQFCGNAKAETYDTVFVDYFSKKDSIYRIDKILNLKNGVLKLPEGCTLVFEGGVIRNGKIVFQGNKVLNPCFENCRFEGSIINETFHINEYGAKAGTDMDCSIIINDIIRLTSPAIPSRSAKTIVVPNGTFYIESPIVLWAGWEAPITIIGNGPTSTICQKKNNEFIFKIYESHNIKNLRLTYKERQSLNDKKSIAIASQRAAFCQFEDLLISKSNTAFGYIPVAEAKSDGLTGLKDQCYMNCNFRNVRIYEFSGYAFDFKKELSRGDSGSIFDNIYVSSDDWLSQTNDNVSMGAMRGESSVINITQMNVEGKHFSSPLFNLVGESILNAQTIHIEWLNNLPCITKVENGSLVDINVFDLQSCTFSANSQPCFITKGTGHIEIGSLNIRPDNKNASSGKRISYSTEKNNVIVHYLLDKKGLFK